jgi:hypothetical protein
MQFAGVLFARVKFAVSAKIREGVSTAHGIVSVQPGGSAATSWSAVGSL